MSGGDGDPLTVSVLAVTGIDEVTTSTDLPAVIVEACGRLGRALGPGQVLCVSSKVVSKWLGLTADDRDTAVEADTRTVVAVRATPRGVTSVVRSVAGPVLAGAGVDESNVGPSGRPLRLPADPDGAAQLLRARIAALLPTRDAVTLPPAVVVTDTAGRPWRDGQTDFALGVAGLAPVDDARGRPDADGRRMDVTVRALADEVAAAADLVKGKVAGVPVALVDGLERWVTAEDGPGAARLVRDPDDDWFSRGAVEAVHEALGVQASHVAVPRVPGRLPDAPGAALRRAVAVATTGPRAPDAATVTVQTPETAVTTPTGDAGGAVRHRVVVTGDPVSAGRLAERIVTAAAAEGLHLDVETEQRAGRALLELRPR